MAEAPQELRRIHWSECFNFIHVFRSFRQAIHVNKLVFAFVGILLTYLAGRLLDFFWVASSQPAIDAHGMNELAVFIAGGGDRAATLQWLENLSQGGEVSRIGCFSLVLHHAMATVNQLIDAVLNVSPAGVLGGIREGLLGAVWLVSMHWLYALLFGVISLLIWGFFGGALCRTAALHAARDERITYGEAMSFACRKMLAFAAAPVLPIVMVVLFGVLLLLGGLIGAIPAIGEVFVGLLFFLALLLGLAIAFLLIGLAAGFGMSFPTIAVENSDAFDALSRIGAYVFGRPWRTALYYLSALVHGAICLAFVKLLARIMLWSVHFFLGLSMNLGGAFQADSDAPRAAKLDAIWQAPALIGGDTTFYGSFGETKLAHFSAFGQFLIKGWVYGVWGLVAAVAVSYFFCANTIIYLLLRREVDATDMEDVYLDDLNDETATPPSPGAPPGGSGSGGAGASGGTSLPVIG